MAFITNSVPDMEIPYEVSGSMGSEAKAEGGFVQKKIELLPNGLPSSEGFEIHELSLPSIQQASFQRIEESLKNIDCSLELENRELSLLFQRQALKPEEQHGPILASICNVFGWHQNTLAWKVSYLFEKYKLAGNDSAVLTDLHACEMEKKWAEGASDFFNNALRIRSQLDLKDAECADLEKQLAPLDEILMIQSSNLDDYPEDKISHLEDISEKLLNSYDEKKYLLEEKRKWDGRSSPALEEAIQEATKKIEETENKIVLILSLQLRIMELRRKIMEEEEEQVTARRILAPLYSMVLDSQPKLDPQFRGGDPKTELCRMKSDLESFMKFAKENLSKEQKTHLETCCQRLLDAQNLCSIEKGQEEDTAWKIHQDISNLKVGEFYLLPGCAERHSFLYEIKKTEMGYLFTIVNTGSDEPDIWEEVRGFEFDFRYEIEDHRFFRYAHLAYVFSFDALNTKLLQELFLMQTDELPMPEVIKKIDGLMTDIQGKKILGRKHHTQGRGSCTVKSITSWLKGDLIENFGQSNGNSLYLQFKTYRTEKALEGFSEWDRQASKEVAKKAYAVETDEQLKERIANRDMAAHTVYEKRKNKSKALISPFQLRSATTADLVGGESRVISLFSPSSPGFDLRSLKTSMGVRNCSTFLSRSLSMFLLPFTTS